MSPMRRLHVRELSLLCLHRLPRIRGLEAGGGKGSDDRVDGVVIHQHTAAGRRHVSGEVILGGGKDGGKPGALAHSYPRLLRLVAPEDVLEPVDVEEEVDRLFPEAGAAPGADSKARVVQLVVLLLLGQGRIRPQHLVDNLVGLHGSERTLDVADEVEAGASPAELSWDPSMDTEDGIIDGRSQREGVEEVVHCFPDCVPVRVSKEGDALRKEAPLHVVLHVAIDLARLVVPPDHPPLVGMQDLHAHYVGHNCNRVSAAVHEVSEEQEVSCRHFRSQWPEGLPEELQIVQVTMHVSEDIDRRAGFQDPRFPSSDPRGTLSDGYDGPLQHTNVNAKLRGSARRRGRFQQRLRDCKKTQGILGSHALCIPRVLQPRGNLLEGHTMHIVVHGCDVGRETDVLRFRVMRRMMVLLNVTLPLISDKIQDPVTVPLLRKAENFYRQPRNSVHVTARSRFVQVEPV
mmetsp:Transcript_32831/g.103822  ORF Transcript_32831/g.103822 Transcript_32831/m.103822 type:complete len:459 (+) Transcript_32831:299-1675(+)